MIIQQAFYLFFLIAAIWLFYQLCLIQEIFQSSLCKMANFADAFSHSVNNFIKFLILAFEQFMYFYKTRALNIPMLPSLEKRPRMLFSSA